MRDFDSIVKDKEIPWVRHWIDATFEFSKNFIKPGTTNEIDFEALGKEEWEFRKALKTKDFTSSKRAEYLWNEAIKLRDRNRANGSKGGRPKKNPQDAPNCNAGVDGKSATSCDQFSADVDTSDGSIANTHVSSITRNETRTNDALGSSANLYGDATHREAVDESANISKPFALDMPRPDKASDPSGHNTGNVPPSHGHEDGKPFALDSLNRQGQTTAKTRDSRGSGRYQPPSLGPEDGNLFTTKKPSTISANERRTGGSIREAVNPLPPVRQSEPDVMSLAYSGEFGNVRLTQEQYAELGIKFGNQQKLNRAIDSLSCKLENDELKPAPRSHYAVLVKWANYRDDMEEKEELKASSAPHYETVSEHNARIVRESDKWIDEYYAQKRKAANGK